MGLGESGFPGLLPHLNIGTRVLPFFSYRCSDREAARQMFAQPGGATLREVQTELRCSIGWAHKVGRRMPAPAPMPCLGPPLQDQEEQNRIIFEVLPT